MTGTINLDAFKGMSRMSQADLRDFLEGEMTLVRAEVVAARGPRPPHLNPTKGYRGAHKLFRRGKR